MSKEKLKVLIVDDQAGVRFLLSAVVEETGHLSYQAKSGVEAVRLAKSIVPDLVLMDVRMPLMSGLEALVKMKESNSGIKVVLMSAYCTEEIVESGMEKGALACISKPFDVSYIKGLIEDIGNDSASGNYTACNI